MYRFFSIIERIDWLMLVPVLLLSLLGLAVIGSVGLAHDPSTLVPVIKQAMALGVGILFALLLVFANYKILDHYARTIYIGSLVFLILVLFFGKIINGTRGWFLIAGWSVQPVEFAKIGLVLIMARFMSKHANVRDTSSLISSFILTLVPVGLILLQPDVGSALLFLGMWFVSVLMVGMSRRHVITLFVAILVLVSFSWIFLLKEYQKERVRIFIDPSRAPLSQGYNSTQAKIAIGAGGWFGRGLGYGSQSQLRFVPEAQTDFIFSVIGEELGFFGVASMFALFGLFFYRAYRLAERSKDNFSLFIVVGLMTELFLSVVVNTGMNLGLLPVTGIALPFLSSGGSSLIATWIAVGILESIFVRTEGVSATLTSEAAGVTIGL